MAEIDLSAGTIEYEDTGGLAIGPSLWRHVVANLRTDHRCVVVGAVLPGPRGVS